MKFLVVLLSVALCVSALPHDHDHGCKKNEVWNECGNPCTDVCPNGRMCATLCQEMCSCMEGFKRNSKGECVEETACAEVSPLCTDPNHRYTLSNPCTGKCNSESMMCTQTVEWGCHCKEGFRADANQNGKCVSQEQCPRVDETSKCALAFQKYELSSEKESICGAKDNLKRYGCWCMKGYKYDATKEKCVREREC